MKEWTPKARGALLALGAFIAISALTTILDHFFTQVHLPITRDYLRLILMDASLFLLVPLVVWWWRIGKRKTPSRLIRESTWMTWGSVLLIFALAFALRVVLTLQDTLLREKIPITYLVLLTTVVAEGLSPSAIGLSWRKAMRQILLGVFLFLIFAMPTTLGLTWLVTGRNPFQGFDFTYLALFLPFQILGVALAEEMLFRGYMQTKLENVIPSWGAILLQAIFFGAWHFVRWISPLRLEPMAFHVSTSLLFGVILGTYYHHTRSLIGPIVLHALFNSTLAAAGFGAWRLASTGPMYMSLAGLAACTLAVFVVVFARHLSSLFGATPTPGGSLQTP